MMRNPRWTGLILSATLVGQPVAAATELNVALPASLTEKWETKLQKPMGEAPEFEPFLTGLPAARGAARITAPVAPYSMPVDGNIVSGGAVKSTVPDELPPLEAWFSSLRALFSFQKDAAEVRRELMSLAETLAVLLVPLLIWQGYVITRSRLRRLRPVGWAG